MQGFSAVFQMVRLCINQLSAAQSSSDVNNSAASHEILRVLWNGELHYCVHNTLPLVPALRQINLVYTLPLRSI